MPVSAAEAWVRLGAALAVSAMLHGVLVYGVALPAPSATPVFPVLLARLAQPEPSKRPVSPAATPLRTSRPESIRAREATALGSDLGPAPQTQSLGVSAALPASALPLIEDVTWYSALDLDFYPRTLAPLQFEYPAHALSEGRMGEVSLAVRIDATGQTQAVRIIEANPPGYFEESAIAAVNAARFTPAQKDGRNVRSEIVVRLVYDPDVQPSAARTTSALPPEPQ